MNVGKFIVAQGSIFIALPLVAHEDGQVCLDAECNKVSLRHTHTYPVA